MQFWSWSIWDLLYSWLPLINLLFAIPIIFLERRNIGVTWAWLILLLLLPVVGFLLYIILGQNLARQKVYKIKPKTQRYVREMIIGQAGKFKRGSIKFRDANVQKHQSLVYMNLVSSYSLLTQNNDVDIFTDGKKKFDALLESITEAVDHIHMLYYKIGNDKLGKLVLSALTQKAKEGVTVRISYDAIGSQGVSKALFQELQAAGGKVYPFFPSKIPFLNLRVNYRNHRKIVIIDGAVGFIGGFNIGDEYLGEDPVIGLWRDTHLKIKGDAVHRLQMQFILDWSLASGEFIPFDPPFFPEIDSDGMTSMQIVASGPDSDKMQIRDGYVKMIFEANTSVFIQTPYFIPDDSILNALKIAAASGIDVRIMIPRKADHALVQLATYSYIGELLRAGVKCYLYEKGFLHAKTIMIDAEVASVGTANLDYRSLMLNFEINAFLYDPNEAAELEAIFEKDMESSTQLTWEGYQRRSIFLRLSESMARLFSPIL
ncbi:cardiolipin synthase [Paenibacillus eucommiae]|uniref:Cardiolipin synthase n=1 Tax=Paenibacillus eucommiae TaxID=1355755 RepID=A0ABS4IZT5_9BACL|nr:cardiolipin synthase [Paenibacillus eucommiae]MBP1993092.1 cardiolipin synthase [Paenibacillus eucommiae]